jgi:hypothetical protein
MISYRCTPEDGDAYDLVADSRDILEWELAKPSRYFGQLQAKPALADLVEIAYFASRRRKFWTGEYGEFRRQVQVEPTAGSEGAGVMDPTQSEV